MLGRDRCVRRFVNVGEHRNAQRRSDCTDHCQALVATGTSVASERRSIGLVVAGFEDVADTESRADVFHALGDFSAEILALDHARAGDHDERLTVAARHAPAEVGTRWSGVWLV